MNWSPSARQESLPAGEGKQPPVARKPSVKDIADFLRDMAGMFENPITGNPALGDALGKLSKVLRRYADGELEDVLSGLTYARGRRSERRVSRPSQIHGLNLASLDLKSVRELLDTPGLTKTDLVRIAQERFGIPKSKLERQRREATIEAIHAALSNAEALDIIAEQARSEGSQRVI